MTMSFEDALDQRFLGAVAGLADAPEHLAGTAAPAAVPLNDERLLALFDAQAGSRAARRRLHRAGRAKAAKARGSCSRGNEASRRSSS